METELILLLAAAMLALVQAVLPPIVGRRQADGQMERRVVYDGLAGRLQRAHRNLLESLPVFAILVIMGKVTGQLNETTRLAAHLFFWSRLAYVPAYASGIPLLRTGIWTVSIAGLVIIFVQLAG